MSGLLQGANEAETFGYKEIRGKIGVPGIISRIIFGAWQVLMLAWLIDFTTGAAQIVKESESELLTNIVAAGTTLGFGFILFYWSAGSIVLGLFVLFTRPSRILVRMSPGDEAAPKQPVLETEAAALAGSEPDKTAKMAIITVASLVILAAAGLKLSISDSPNSVGAQKIAKNELTASRTQANKCAVTLKQFSEIRIGAYLNEIEALFGCKGTELSTIHISGYGTTSMYSWPGRSGIANVTLTFRNSRLESRAQFGLD